MKEKSIIESVKIVGEASFEKIMVEKGRIVIGFSSVDAKKTINLKLNINIKNADGSRETFEETLNIPVDLDSSYLEKWNTEIDDLLTKLDAKETRLAEWLLLARKKLDECKRILAVFGVDCSSIESAIHDATDEIRGFEERLNNILNLINKEIQVEVIQEIAELSEYCNKKGRYYGLPQCNKLEALILEAVKRTSNKIEELYNNKKYDEASPLGEMDLLLCRKKVRGTGGYCGRIEQILKKINDIRRFLEEMIYVHIPTYSPSKEMIKSKIIVKYDGGSVIEGVVVDFTPSKGYLEDPPIISLPKIVPGVQFVKDVLLKAVVQGRIPVMYKVCHQDYCLDQRRDTAVGTPHIEISQIDIKKLNIRDFVGRGIPELKQLDIKPLTPRMLAKPIRIDRYECTGYLKTGGFASTLFCHDEKGERVVVKIPKEIHEELAHGYSTLLAEGSAAREYSKELLLFDEEARILRLLEHPNIIKMINYGIEPFPYLVFEYCDYGDLSRILKGRERLDPGLALKIMIPIADALRYGHEHEKNIIHLDLKPSNILIDKKLIPKLSDYNIAVIMSTVSRSTRGRLARRGHTPGFSAPEQVNINLPAPKEYSDIFAHAATLYYIITGRHVYPLKMWDQDQFRSEIEYTPARRYNPSVPEELDEVLAAALRINPLEREYQTVRQYLADLVKIYNKYYK